MAIGQRTRFLYEYAREHGGTERFEELLRELRARHSFGAELSLFLARVTENADHIRSLLNHDDCDVARYAMRLAVDLGGSEDPIEAAVLSGPLLLRRSAFRALRRSRREALADRLLPAVRERFGEREAALLLPACGGTAIAEHLTDLSHAVTAWATLGHRHPAVFAAYAEAALAALSKPQRAEWWLHHRDGVIEAADAEPAVWLGLFDRFWTGRPLIGIVGQVLPRLTSADPDAAWRFLLAADRKELIETIRWRRSVLRRLARSDTATIAALVRRRPQHLEAPVIGLLPPSRRQAVLEAARAEHRDERWHNFLDQLPRPLRHRTARRRIVHRKIADARPHRERLRSYLPFDEVRSELVEATGRSSGEERAVAYGNLIRCAGLDGPEALAAVLDSSDRLARDQDPVHLAAVAALALVPAHSWTESHLEPLGGLLRAILGSPWRSADTNAAVLRLASRMLIIGRSHGRSAFADFGRDHFVLAAAECGGRTIGEALGRLPRPAVVELCRRMLPVMADEAEVGRFKLPLRFAGALGRHAREVPELASLLFQGARSGDADTAPRTATALLRLEPGRAVELVEADRSLAGVRAVFRRLAADRIDLLVPRFGSIDDEAALRAAPARILTRRWPPAARDAYLATLASYALDHRRSTWVRGYAVRAMSNTAGLSTGHLNELLASEEPLLRSAALAALHAAEPAERAWDELYSHSTGPDSAVAAVGLGRLARRIRPETLAGLVAPMAESEAVATRKQGVRLLLQHRLPEAEDRVQRMWSDPDQHPGVRETIVGALVHRLELPWGREIVWESVRHGADVAAPAIALAPSAIPARHRDEYAKFVAEAVASGDERMLETCLVGVNRWARHSDRTGEAVIGLASDLDATAHWAKAMSTLVELAVEGGEWEPLLETVRRLRGNDRVEPNATAERDLPVRQRLQRLVGLLLRSGGGRGPEGVPDSLPALLPTELGTRIKFATVSWRACPIELRGLVDRIGDPVEAHELGKLLERRMWLEQDAGLLPFFEGLIASGDADACVLAAAVIGKPAARAGWTPEWRELLRRLRAHPAPVVARLARRVYTSAE